ncbi:Calx-beta domain-containing protein [Singulisphaera acidiphila]|uniref:Calx-beta domain-containing protein n=1 Tax=Singulisphaera acidiphila (strain ATCC BAA-1392 / DSM 18658 / VKM B-2454 / MOB10) TaxID=886293 RepID=L0DJR7_SINAD|nr:Calx-beta domain-containing protein [Singulisphaera acidiphila]AGA29090.1 Calx-beta domain-containing protein [Singulisphaera acidiphila DSM 18658]
MSQRSLPPQGARPLRQRQSAWLWDECESRQLLSVTINNVTMIEPASGTANAVFTVSRDQTHLKESATVDFATQDATAKAGKDYQEVHGTLTFAPGETSKEIAVPIIGGLAREPHDMFTVNLTNPVNETLNPSLRVGIATILPTPWLSIGDVSVIEGDSGTTNAVFKVTLDPSNPDQIVSVPYSTVDGTAKAGSDYQATSGTLTFAPGETSKTITVPINHGTSVEPVESFFVDLKTPQNAIVRDGRGTGTITNNTKAGTVQFQAPAYRADAQAGTATITVTRAEGTASGVGINYATQGGSAVAGTDYTPVSGTLTFAAGQTSQTISVPVLANPKRTSDQTVNLVLSNPTGGGTLGSTRQTTLTITAPIPSTPTPSTPTPTPSTPTPTPSTPTPTPSTPTPTPSTPTPGAPEPAGSITNDSPVVTNTDDHGPGSLRQAILDANANPGLDTIRFALPGEGPQSIRLTSALPPITDPVIIDGTTQHGYQKSPLIELTGIDAGSQANGLTLNAGGSTIRGLAINGFEGSGILIQGAGGNRVAGNVIGTSLDGESAKGNGLAGISIVQSSNNVIGGSASTAGNLVSGNSGSGIVLSGTSTKQNLVQGNHIGTDIDGDDPLGNQLDGIVLDNAPENRIGGVEPGQGNLISGNQLTGLRILGSGATGNLIQGNEIGTDRTGTRAIGNRFDGIFNSGAPGNTIGGPTANAGNLISGNGGVGVQFHSQGASGNQLQGNLIGTDATGTLPIGNAHGGVFLNHARNNIVGGTSKDARNVISGNPLVGVQLAGRSAAGNVVQGNLIGTDIQGAPRLGNTVGLFLGGTTGNTIGGPGSAANLVAGNVRADIATKPIPVSRSTGVDRPQAHATGPSITAVTKNVNGSELTSLVVKFSEPVNRSRAEDIGNYRLRLPGRGNNFSAADAIAVPVRSASYDSSTTSVTLTLATPLRSGGPVQFRVSGQPGRGVADLAGHSLVGVGQQAGTDYVTILRLTS